MNGQQPLTIGIRMPNWLGDVCMALPAVDLARTSLLQGRTGGRLILLAREPLASLLRRCVGGVEVAAVDRWGRVSDAETPKFDGLILLTNTVRPALQAWTKGVPIRAGAAKRWLVRWLLTHRSKPIPAMPLALLQASDPPADWTGASTVEGYLRTVRMGLSALGLRADAPACGGGVLQPDLAAKEGARQWLHSHGLQPSAESILIGYQAGAAYGTAKRYPVHLLAQALERILAAEPRAVCIGLGSMAEAVDLAAVQGALSGSFAPRVIVPRHGLDLPGFAGLVSHLDLVIANDSGPMHIAVAVETPCVAVFGPTDWMSTGYADGPQYRLIRQPGVACAPCIKRHCPLGHHRCMNEVAPERVAQAALALLNSTTKETGSSSEPLSGG